MPRNLTFGITLLAAVLSALCVLAQPARAETACEARAPYRPGLSARSLKTGGVERAYYIHVPRGLAPSRPAPLVLDLQASGLSPAVELALTGMRKAAERYGFIVAAPAAVTPYARGGTTWNVPPLPGGPNDVNFIRAVLAQVEADYCIDGKRVFAAGFSGGARFASELACQMPERFAAIAAVGGLRYSNEDGGSCVRAGLPLAIIAFHSMDDPINPYDAAAAKAPPYWTYGIETALERWARRNGCGGPVNRDKVSAGITRRVYGGCRDGGEITFYRLRGSGHVWPGSAFDFPDYLGRKEPALPATELIVEFFLEHGRGGAAKN